MAARPQSVIAFQHITIAIPHTGVNVQIINDIVLVQYFI